MQQLQICNNGPLHSSPISEATWNPLYSAHTSSYKVHTWKSALYGRNYMPYDQFWIPGPNM